MFALCGTKNKMLQFSKSCMTLKRARPPHWQPLTLCAHTTVFTFLKFMMCTLKNKYMDT